MGHVKGAFRLVNGRREFIHPYTAAQEAALVLRLKAGDATARGQVAVDFAPLVERMAYKSARPHMPKDDLVQAANIKLLSPKAYEGYNPLPGHTIGAWISQLAQNAMRDELRGANRYDASFSSLDALLDPNEEGSTLTRGDMIASTIAEPAAVLQARQTREQLACQVDQLPGMQRMVVELLMNGSQLKDAATLLDISEGSAKTHASRARTALSSLRSALE